MLQKVMTIILSALRRLGKPEKEPSPQITLPSTVSQVSAEPTPKIGVATVSPKKPESALTSPPEPARVVAIAPEEEKKLSQLYPHFAQLVRCLVLEARANGMQVGVFCGLRTFEEQRALFQKGRDSSGKVIDKKSVVTNAPPGLSMHNYGLAVDLVFDGNPNKPGWQWSWDSKHPWKELAELGRKTGLSPAYFWKSFPESPHFEQTYGFTYRELSSLHNAAGMSGVWTEIDKRRQEQKKA